MQSCAGCFTEYFDIELDTCTIEVVLHCSVCYPLVFDRAAFNKNINMNEFTWEI